MSDLDKVVAYIRRCKIDYSADSIWRQLRKDMVPEETIKKAFEIVMTNAADAPEPAAKPAASTRPLGYQPPTAPAFTPPNRAFILVVDDDPAVLTMMSNKLEAAGYRITTASDAAESVIQAQAMKLALIISDIQMPGFGTGVDALKKLRNERQVPKNLPVIFVTGMMLEKAHEMIPESDPYVRVINKPVDWELLARYIRDLTGLDKRL